MTMIATTPTPRKRASGVVVTLWEHAKAHHTAPSLAKRVLAEMIERTGETPFKTLRHKRGRVFGIDLGGMALTTTPWVELPLGNGYTFEVALDQVADVLVRVVQAPLRHFADGTPYFKIHGRWICVVLTPRQKQTLERALHRFVLRAHDRIQMENDRRLNALRGVAQHPRIHIENLEPEAPKVKA